MVSKKIFEVLQGAYQGFGFEFIEVTVAFTIRRKKKFKCYVKSVARGTARKADWTHLGGADRVTILQQIQTHDAAQVRI
jgi:hypothetical protein